MDLQSSSKINYWVVPSLKHLALVKLASTLWNHSVDRNLFSKNFSYDNGISKDVWQTFEDAVIEKVPELHIPRELEELLIFYIHPVGFQILDWINFHAVYCGCVIFTELPNEFFWEPQGIIDNKKVAESLVNNERLGIFARFTLACIYCFEKHIRLFFKELPKGFYKDRNVEAIVKVWSYYVAEEIDQLLYVDLELKRGTADDVTFSQLGFHVSVFIGNKAGARYFLHRFTPEDKAKFLVKNTTLLCRNRKFRIPKKGYFSKYHYSNNLCYLFSEMDKDQQTNLVSLYAYDILHYLLNWPWQNFFLKTTKAIWSFLSKAHYYSLLRAIREKICSGEKDFNYQNLFGKFWQQSSFAYKRYVIKKGGLKSLASALLPIGDKENVKLIFEAATMQEKDKFIFCRKGHFICRTLMENSNWKLLKFFIEECTSSKEVFHELKDKLENMFIIFLFCDTTKKGKENMLKELNQLLLDIEQKNKRKWVNDEINSSTKKFCNSS